MAMDSTVYVDDIREIKEQNPFESMMSRFDRAAQLLDLDPDLYAVMRVPNRELKVGFSGAAQFRSRTSERGHTLRA